MERRAWMYRAAMMEGNDINWETGEIKPRK